MTRQGQKGWPAGGWYPQEKMTLEEAAKGFTLYAAYARFAEGLTGSIEVGKLADFTILDKDIFSVPPKRILQTKVVYTIVGGRVVYTANQDR